MENNVNTLPSKENNRISINWMIFNPKEKEIDAKKLKIGKGATKIVSKIAGFGIDNIDKIMCG